jgi:hypothetical protein
VSVELERTSGSAGGVRPQHSVRRLVPRHHHLAALAQRSHSRQLLRLLLTEGTQHPPAPWVMRPQWHVAVCVAVYHTLPRLHEPASIGHKDVSWWLRQLGKPGHDGCIHCGQECCYDTAATLAVSGRWCGIGWCSPVLRVACVVRLARCIRAPRRCAAHHRGHTASPATQE